LVIDTDDVVLDQGQSLSIGGPGEVGPRSARLDSSRSMNGRCRSVDER
jgi:hypothetical protein